LEYINLNRIWEEHIDIVKKRKISFREIGVTVSRGCPFNCPFCWVPTIDGLKDRRRPVRDLVTWLTNMQRKYKPDYFNFASPVFTINKKWLEEFAKELAKNDIKINYRCVTRIDLLDDDTIELLKESGCERVGIGIETFYKEANEAINKEFSKDLVIDRIRALVRRNISPLIYLMGGITGKKEEINVLVKTIKTLRKYGAEVRVTSYQDYSHTSLVEDPIEFSLESSKTLSAHYRFEDGKDHLKLLDIVLNTADY